MLLNLFEISTSRCFRIPRRANTKAIIDFICLKLDRVLGVENKQAMNQNICIGSARNFDENFISVDALCVAWLE